MRHRPCVHLLPSDRRSNVTANTYILFASAFLCSPFQEIDESEFERIQKEMTERAAESKKRTAPAASAGGKASAPKRKKK